MPQASARDRNGPLAAASALPGRMPVGLPARAGVGLKPEHFRDVLSTRPDIGFFEVHAENYMVDGGPFHHFLTRIRAHYPLSLHGVGLSIGGIGPLDEAHLDRLAALIDRYDRVQERLQRRMLLENPSTYLEFEASTMSEAGFLCEVLRRTGCGLLLDVNNAYVSCTNHGRDALAYIRELPLAAVGEIHLAGFARDHDAAGAALLIDSHGTPVDEAVWSLYAQAIASTGAVPTLLERDHDVPTLATLLAEAQRAEDLMTLRTQARHCSAYRGCA